MKREKPNAESPSRMRLRTVAYVQVVLANCFSFVRSLDWDPIEGGRPVTKVCSSVRSVRESGCLKVQPKVGGKFHLRLNIGERPIANKYREGKLKRTLKREFKRA